MKGGMEGLVDFDTVSSSVVAIQAYDAKGNRLRLASGVVLANELVATNCRVIEQGVKIEVMHLGTKYSAILRHTDWDRDICILSVSGINAPAAVIGSTSRLKVGTRAYAIGAPKGLELTLSEIIISGLRPIEGGQYIQISPSVLPDPDSGGLYDVEGRLIGLLSSYSFEEQQVNFAVPVEWISELPKRHKVMVNTDQTTTIEWVSRAVAFDKKKDWDGLLVHSLRWAETQPKEAGAWFSLGIAYRESGRSAEAIEALKRVLCINKVYADAWHNLGYAYLVSGRGAEAIDAFQQSLRINSEHADVWYNLGVAYGECDRATEAIDAFQQALRINPEDADVWNNLGLNYQESGRGAEAIDAFQQSLRINSEDADVWNNLSVSYYISGQTTKVIESYLQSLRINPEDAEVWNNLGVAYHQSGQSVEAIDALQRALCINSEYADAWYNLGVAYYQSGQSVLLAEIYNHLKRLDPARAYEFFSEFVSP
jgi:tetratricopeptide (TPR) repeat protein